MSSTCLMVLGVPRSGSSCTAGVLHRLGVDMGAGHFQPTDWANPRGYYEDMRWRLRTQRITGKGYSLKAAHVESIGKQQRAVYRALARECATQRLWGMKDPWLCFMARFVWPVLVDVGVEVRMVVTQRPREASIASVQRHLDKTYHGKGNAAHIIDTWQAGLDQQLVLWQGPVHQVDYDRLTREPEIVIRELAQFAFIGTGITPNEIAPVAAWVTPSLNHHKGVG